MIQITKENIDSILNVLYGFILSETDKEDIKLILFSDSMTPKGNLKTISAIFGNCKYVCIKKKDFPELDVHAIDRDNSKKVFTPYIKTIFYFRDVYYWGCYGDFIEGQGNYNEIETI